MSGRSVRYTALLSKAVLNSAQHLSVMSWSSWVHTSQHRKLCRRLCCWLCSQSLEDIIAMGVPRVLTSGGCPSAEEVRPRCCMP